MIKMRKTDAYFTVEAALVMPFVIGVILLTVYLLFFQYDRCLMEQGAQTIALRGCTLQIAEGEELVRELSAQSHRDDKGYLAWEMADVKIRLKGNCVRVERSGELVFPFQGIMFWGGGNIWESRTVYESHRIKPVNFIRSCRKIMGGK